MGDSSGRHVCCSAKEQEDLICQLNEYVHRLRQMDTMSQYGKYCTVPEFMKTKQPRYEENKEAAPLITSVPVMEFRLTYDKNKLKKNMEHPNLTYILIEDPPAETEKIPVTCHCCNLRCFSLYPPSKQTPSCNICFPCYYYCYPYNQYVSTPQKTCVLQQFQQCQPQRLQTIPQYCVPTWSQQPCFHWGEGCVPVCQSAENGNTEKSDDSCKSPVCKERGQQANCPDITKLGQETKDFNDLQPSDCTPIRPISPKCTEDPSSKKIFSDDQQITIVDDDDKPTSPKGTRNIHQVSNDAYVCSAVISLDKRAECTTDPPNPPKEEPKEEVKPQQERVIKPYKRYRLKAPYMYDVSDSELYPS